MKVKIQRGFRSAVVAAALSFSANLHGQDLNTSAMTNPTGIAI